MNLSLALRPVYLPRGSQIAVHRRSVDDTQLFQSVSLHVTKSSYETFLNKKVNFLTKSIIPYIWYEW